MRGLPYGHGAPDPSHPIVAAALAANGVTPYAVRSDPAWAGGESQRFGDGEATPVVTCEERRITVHMHGPEDRIVFYMYEDTDDPRESFWVHHLEFRNWVPPQSVIPALVGRTADVVADVPGAAGLFIVRASQMGGGLVLVLAPPGMRRR